MQYNFDEIVDRKGTNCIKYDFAAERGKPADILPLWVADMDFKTAPEIIESLHKAVEHGIYGYTEGKREYYDSVYNWYKDNHGWEVKREWLVKTPGVVFGLATAVRAFTNKGDGVLIQKPVYYPFTEVIEDNGRVLVNSPLKNINGHYEMDFDDFEKKIVDNNVKLFLLCSPHNPVGRVWKKEELEKVGDICVKHGVIVVSDEIHADFTYPGHKHLVFANLKPEFAEISITCTAPSKTFNLAGLQISNIFIPNTNLRRKFRNQVNAAGYSQVNIMGLVACQAAYEEGKTWLEALKEYLYENLNFVREYLEDNIPNIKLIEPEGTYLIWLDCSELGLSNDELENLIVNKAKLWLDGGAMFGSEGDNFQRINIACPRDILKKALLQLKIAVEQ